MLSTSHNFSFDRLCYLRRTVLEYIMRKSFIIQTLSINVQHCGIWRLRFCKRDFRQAVLLEDGRWKKVLERRLPHVIVYLFLLLSLHFVKTGKSASFKVLM